LAVPSLKKLLNNSDQQASGVEMKKTAATALTILTCLFPLTSFVNADSTVTPSSAAGGVNLAGEGLAVVLVIAVAVGIIYAGYKLVKRASAH
jgi:hypothetical protein